MLLSDLEDFFWIFFFFVSDFMMRFSSNSHFTSDLGLRFYVSPPFFYLKFSAYAPMNGISEDRSPESSNFGVIDFLFIYACITELQNELWEKNKAKKKICADDETLYN